MLFFKNVNAWKLSITHFGLFFSFTARCSCQNVFVQGTACWVINGNYIRSDILKKQNSTSNLSPSTWSSSQSDKYFDLTTGKQGNTDVNVSETNVTNPKLTENSLNKIKGMSILEQSNCLLAKLAECIDSQDNVNSKSSDDQEENGGKDDGCQQYISVLANSTWQDSGMDTDHTINSTAKYILEGKKKDYILTQDEDGNFWWIVDQNEVYAVSDEAGPCPDQLPSNACHILPHYHHHAFPPWSPHPPAQPPALPPWLPYILLPQWPSPWILHPSSPPS